MAASANPPPTTRRSSVVTQTAHSPPLGEPPRRYHSGPSLPSPSLSTYSNDTTQRRNTRPQSFPPQPVFSREGTSCSIASSKTGGLHSRTHSVEFLVAHDRSSKVTSRPPPTLQVQSESFWPSGSVLCCFVDPDGDFLGSAWLGGLIKAPVVRQFLHNGHLYKEEEERAISHFELFADLVFVAVIHVSGDGVAMERSIF